MHSLKNKLKYRSTTIRHVETVVSSEAIAGFAGRDDSAVFQESLIFSDGFLNILAHPPGFFLIATHCTDGDILILPKILAVFFNYPYPRSDWGRNLSYRDASPRLAELPLLAMVSDDAHHHHDHHGHRWQ